jgi:hypothetical protein
MTDEDRLKDDKLRIETKAKAYAENNKQIPNDFYEAEILSRRDFVRGAEYEREFRMFTINGQLSEIIRLRSIIEENNKEIEHLKTFHDLRNY